MKLRLILNLEGLDGYKQMAIDEALLILRNRDQIPNTLRLYVFKPHAVTIGYFQRIREVVDEMVIQLESVFNMQIENLRNSIGSEISNINKKLIYEKNILFNGSHFHFIFINFLCCAK